MSMTKQDVVPVIITRSPDSSDQPVGRLHEVGVWITEHEVVHGELPPGAEVLTDIAETLRVNAQPGQPLHDYGRGCSHLLTEVGAIEFTLRRRDEPNPLPGEDWDVAFVRGPRVRLTELAQQVSKLATFGIE